jgi:poly-gamma-glutamate capsule biosynthesis protein CapA/YwtB (metallophosphatase superfamily)
MSMKLRLPEIYKQLFIAPRKTFRPRYFRRAICFASMALIVLFQSVVNSSAQPVTRTVEIAAVGDILLARGVERQIEKHGAKYPFEKVAEILSKADLVFGNLENPLTNNCAKADKKFSFKARAEYSKILGAASFDVLSLANNHSLDCGKRGLLETFENLEKENLRWIGAGKTKAEIVSPVYFEANEIKIAFLGFTAVSPGKLAEKSPRVAFATEENITGAIKAARAKADVIIVSFHWGTEYAARPNDEQIRLAETAVKAGADVILGHHPHVLQPFQLMHKSNGEGQALVAYSLGNFLFDSPVKLNKRVGESVILKIRLDKKGLVAAEVVPVSIENYRPVVADEKNRQLILTHLNRISGDFNTKLENGLIKSKMKNAVEYVKQAD